MNTIDWDKVDNTIDKLSFKGETITGKCVNVYDGDTVKIVFPINNKLYKWNCRLSGVDTPELRTKNLKEKKLGYKVRDELRTKILNKMVLIKCDNFDKYGRLLVDIYLKEPIQFGGSNENKNSNMSINSWLVENKYAFKYDGGTKQSWGDYLNKV